MNNQQQQPNDLKRNVNTLVGLCQCLAYNAETWLRVPGTAGSRYFVGQAGIGWGLFLLIAAFGRSEPLMQFWLATGACLLFQRLTHSVRRRCGYRPHSRFVGVSLLSVLGGNRLAIRLWEPLLTFVVGFSLIQNGYGYGGFVVALSLCLFASAAYTVASERAMVTALHDARADQEWLSQQAGNRQ